ncbi:MAG: hypothetical protein PV344_06110, partial [Anaplasma sp.]|nr:hypothetical protein [Anaplasma sp.]
SMSMNSFPLKPFQTRNVMHATVTQFGLSNNFHGSKECVYCKRLNFRGLKFSQIRPKLKI